MIMKLKLLKVLKTGVTAAFYARRTVNVQCGHIMRRRKLAVSNHTGLWDTIETENILGVDGVLKGVCRIKQLHIIL